MSTKKTPMQVLKHEVTKIKASDIGTLSNAKKNITKAGDNLMASACLITITNLSGDVICDTFAVHDGLSADTIKAIQADIQKTIDMRLALNGLKVS